MKTNRTSSASACTAIEPKGEKAKVDPETCKHPATRLFSWWVKSLGEDILCVCCCDCGAVLAGGAE